MNDVLERLRANYSRFALPLLSQLLELLVATRTASDGDVESFVIVLTVALRMVDQASFRALSYDQIAGGGGDTPLSAGTNLRSIAESTGIPRETVRRKVEALDAAGFLVRRDNLVFCAPEAFAAFTPVREEMLKFVVKGHRVVESLPER